MKYIYLLGRVLFYHGTRNPNPKGKKTFSFGLKSKKDMTDWYYQNLKFDSSSIDQDGYVGFVYCITNLRTNKKYIGKKLFTKSKTRQIKGKKKKTRVPSDWEDYFGSNATLLNEVEEHGKDAFFREILYLCKSKGECSYWEAYEIFKKHAIPSDEYYNEWMSVRVRRSHLKNLELPVSIQ